MYFLYILLCSDNTLYTGITNNLEKRMNTHSEGKGSKYVRSRSPFKVIYKEICADKSSACKRESEIKSWTRKEKISKLKLELL
jgi:putative endonuclease